jgi:hypothetical protein
LPSVSGGKAGAVSVFIAGIFNEIPNLAVL